MVKLDNLTTTSDIIQEESSYDDNKDILWPTVVGLFVALALGWMICRYKCSSKERSPHIVRCCPKSLCKRIRLCCTCLFSFKNESQDSTPDSQMTIMKERLSRHSMIEIPSLLSNTSSLPRPSQQWPPPFLLNTNQGPSFPISIAIQSTTTTTSQPKRHPLRRDSVFLETDRPLGRRDSTPWPFQTANMDFHKQTNAIKKTSFIF